MTGLIKKIFAFIIVNIMVVALIPLTAVQVSASRPISDVLSVFELPTHMDTFVHSGAAGTSYGTDASMIAGRGRTAFVRFDLRDLQAHLAANPYLEIMGAEVRLVQYGTGPNWDFDLRFFPHDTWTGTMTYNTFTGGALATARNTALLGVNLADRFWPSGVNMVNVRDILVRELTNPSGTDPMENPFATNRMDRISFMLSIAPNNLAEENGPHFRSSRFGGTTPTVAQLNQRPRMFVYLIDTYVDTPAPSNRVLFAPGGNFYTADTTAATLNFDGNTFHNQRLGRNRGGGQGRCR